MIADHAARVLTRRAGFRAEARSVGNELQRQRLRRKNLVAHQVGDGHFRSRNQVEGLLAAHDEQVLFELRQLSRAQNRLGLHEQRHIHLRVAVLPGMQVEHELRQGAMQMRDLRTKDHEARS